MAPRAWKKVLVLAMTGLLALSGAVVPAQAADEMPRSGWVPNTPVFAIATAGDRVYIGGRFTFLRNSATGERVNRGRLAALDASTGELIRGWSPSVDNDVRALAVNADGTRVYAGGLFTTANGQGANRVAAFNDTGARVGFAAAANQEVKALVERDGYLYIGGLFGRINNVGRVGLARVDSATGVLDRTWVANVAGGRVRSLDAPEGSADLVVGGNFASLDGQARQHLGSVGLATGQVTGWVPTAICALCLIHDIDREAEATYVAMNGPGGRVVAYPNTSGPFSWAVWADGDVQAVAAKDGVVYAGGHYGPDFGPDVRTQLAAVDATTGQATDFNPVMNGNPYPGVWAISADSDYLRVGGGFTGVGSGSQGRFAEFSY